MRRAILLASWLFVAAVAEALGQGGAPQQGPAQDGTFPAGLGYATVAVAATVWATLSGVVAKLYYSRDQDRRDYQAQVDLLKKEQQQAIDAVRTELRTEIDRLRERLELEQRERREEATTLLREQKEIMREVMTTNAQHMQALAQNTAALERLMADWGGAE
jgi:hypothetical protein